MTRSIGISCRQQRGGYSSSSRHAFVNSCFMQSWQYECECVQATFTVSCSAKLSMQMTHRTLRLRGTTAVDECLTAVDEGLAVVGEGLAAGFFPRIGAVDGPPVFFDSCQLHKSDGTR